MHWSEQKLISALLNVVDIFSIVSKNKIIKFYSIDD